jgi:hypothetical protein
MPFRERALSILWAADQSLRELMQEAISEQSYGDVAAIAAIAQGINAIIEAPKPSTGGTPPSAVAIAQATTSPKPKARSVLVKKRAKRRVRVIKARRIAPTPDGYPKFEREGDRLVKIGWSKRDGRVYEHRAPRAVLWQFLNAIAGAPSSGGTMPFTMDAALPVQTDDGELPSYQAYMALAVLREAGLIRKVGKNSYALTAAANANDAVGPVWESLPTR